jgi:hypothetical protein
MIKFKHLVIFTAMMIAGCAAFFSVYGIGLLFSGAIVAAMIMASSLELGKLVTTTWLFHYWNIANRLMKVYMVTAVIVLMCITSLGIFGYLTAAFQKSSLESELSMTKIVALETQKIQESKKIDNVGITIDKLLSLRSSQESRLSQTLTNAIIARNPIQMQNIQNQINDQISDLNKQIDVENTKLKDAGDKSTKIDEEIFKLKIDNSQKKDITTFKFVADEFHTDIRSVVKWFIIVLITVFDPLAVVLLLAYNMSSNIRQNSEQDFQIYSVKKSAAPTSVEPVVHGNIEEVAKIVEVEKPVDRIVDRIVDRVVDRVVEVEKPVDRIVEKIVEVDKNIIQTIVKKVKNRVQGTRGLFSF